MSRGGQGNNGFVPAFIIGCGRSGSTLLYKMLSLHPDVGFISNWDARFPDNYLCLLLGRFLRGRYHLNLWSWFDTRGSANTRGRSLLRKAIPTPVEGEPLYRQCGFTLDPGQPVRDPAAVQRLRAAFLRLHRLRRTPIVLSKRTRNLHRLELLQAAFPEARYIGIVRDGRAVTDSAVKAPWWSRTGTRAADGAPPDPDTRRLEALRLAGRAWARNMELFEKARATIAPERFSLVVYEDLLRDRRSAMGRLLRFLEIPAHEEYFRTLERIPCVDRVNWHSTWPRALQTEITAVQRPHLERYGYTG